MGKFDTLYKIYYGKYFRLFLALLVFIAGFAILNTVNSKQFYDELLELRKVEIKRITDIAYNTINPILAEYRDGKIDKNEALKQVTTTVRRMTFTDNVTLNYVFMSSYFGEMLVQPYEPEHEGSNMLHLQDFNGKYIIKELIKTAKSPAGRGFVEYNYFPPMGNDPEMKISYVRGIPELEAYIGVGMYIFDLEATFSRGRINAVIYDFLVGVLTIALIFLFIMPYLKTYSLFESTFKEIQNNPEKKPIITGVKDNPRSALQKLVKSFDMMLNSTFSKQTELQEAKDKLLAEIEEKKVTQKELARTTAILKEELAQSPAGIVITDSKTIQANMISKTAIEILGIKMHHLTKLSLSDESELPFEFYNTDGRRVYFRDLSLYQSTTSGINKQNIELQVVRNDGEIRWILSNTSPIFDENNTLIAGIAVFLDITERKSYQLKIEKLNKELEQRVLERTAQLQDAMEELKISREQIIKETQKLYELNEKLYQSEAELREVNASKDKFFNIMAHDIKSPLSGFQSMLEVMAINYERLSVEENKKFISLLQKTSKQLFDLLENLLNWSRSQTGTLEFNPSKTDLRNVIEATLKLYRNNLESKNIKANLQIELSDITADTFMLNTIIRNLISNAIKFSFDNSEIDIVANKKDQNLHISIQDYGVGIKEEDISKLFRIDVNHTTIGTKKEAGTGLGLIICKEFTERHGGTINVDSKPGNGSTFTIVIPAR